MPDAVVEKAETLLKDLGASQSIVTARMLPKEPDRYFSLRGYAPECKPSEVYTGESCLDPYSAAIGYGELSIVSADNLSQMLGVSLNEQQLKQYRDGAIAAPVSDKALWQIPVVKENKAELLEVGYGFGYTSDTGFVDENNNPVSAPEPHSVTSLPAFEVNTPFTHNIVAFIAPETAAALGATAIPNSVIGLGPLNHDPAALERFNAQSQALWAGQNVAGSSWGALTRDPEQPTPWLWAIVGAVAVLVLGAGAVTLGLARVERRNDDATLSAIGATPMLRRNIGFWQGLSIVGLGALTGTIAGLIAAWGISITNPSADFLSMDWWPVLAIAVGLPALTAIANWVIPPKKAELSRRNNFG